MKHTFYALSASFAFCAFSGCATAPKSVTKSGVDFSGIQQVAVQAKDKLAPYISRELLRKGYSPLASARNEKADAIFKVAIARESPEKRYIVRTGKKSAAQQTTTTSGGTTTSSTVILEEGGSHDPVEIQGTYSPYTQRIFTPEGSSEIIAAYAQVSLSGEIISPKTNEVIWAGTYSYEGIDLEAAMEGAARGLVREIPGR